MPFLFLKLAFKKAIKIAKLIVANENTSHLSLCHFIALIDELDCKSEFSRGAIAFKVTDFNESIFCSNDANSKSNEKESNHGFSRGCDWTHGGIVGSGPDENT
ncbi:hypothetical protein [Acinetobacter sp. ANC 3813]|uniref:hypothetical protein n=1 Tax=Acinetobacter sp. ANC 3813 TaxID=1977873 RepID=UPI001D17C574|nr:hypothetical protein [Acinetobacter sp. ANC 3813]